MAKTKENIYWKVDVLNTFAPDKGGDGNSIDIALSLEGINSFKLQGLTLFAIVFILGCTNTTPDSNHSGKPTRVGFENMVLIPGATYQMGGKSDQAYQDELPRHPVEVSSFYMDKTEVTNAQFELFVKSTGYRTVAERDIDWEEIKKQVPAGTPKPPDATLKAGSLVFKKTIGPVNLRDYSQWWTWTLGANWQQPEGLGSSIQDRKSHPVVHISFEDAQAYASWSGKRLPTEAEWEWAATGGQEGNKYPWGDDPIEKATDKANFWQGIFPHKNYSTDGFEGTAPVMSYPANGFGLYDMAGNVWEWCLDKYAIDSYLSDKARGTLKNPLGAQNYKDPREPLSPKHVIRGGSFLCNDSYCSGYRVSRRMSSSKDSGFNHTGFRCVRDIE